MSNDTWSLCLPQQAEAPKDRLAHVLALGHDR